MLSTPLYVEHKKYTNEDFSVICRANQKKLLHCLHCLIAKMWLARENMDKVIQILETGGCEDLRARGNNLSPTECYEVLKGAMQQSSEQYVECKYRDQYEKIMMGEKYGKHIYTDDELLKYVLNIDQIARDESSVVALLVHPVITQEGGLEGDEIVMSTNMDDFTAADIVKGNVDEIQKSLRKGARDILFLKIGQNDRFYNFSSIREVTDYYAKKLQNLYGKRMRNIYSLTHKEDQEQLRKNVERMYHLLYTCDD